MLSQSGTWAHPFPLNPAARRGEAATCGLEPHSSAALRPGDTLVRARGRRPGARQGAPRQRPARPAHPAASGHVVSIATAAPASDTPETLQGQRSSLWQRKPPALRRLGRAASAALRCRAPDSPRSGSRCGRSRELWPRVTTEEGHASPACLLSSGLH